MSDKPSTPSRPTAMVHRNTPVIHCDTPAEIGSMVAQEILEGLATQGHFVLGLPSGRTAQPVVDSLVRLAPQRNCDLTGLHIVLMDEYAVATPEGTWVAVDSELPHSCRGWALRGLIFPLRTWGLSAEQLHCPDPANPRDYPHLIDTLGGVDLFVLASGQSDGHVAMNPQGCTPTEGTRIVPLPDSTRHDNLSTFPSFGGLDDVPHWAVTIGTGDFVARCRSVRMLVWGPDKRLAYQHLTGTRTFDPTWPATIVHECRDAQIIADTDASQS